MEGTFRRLPGRESYLTVDSRGRSNTMAIRLDLLACVRRPPNRFTYFRCYPNVTTLRSGLCCSRKSVCLSSVTLVHPTQVVEPFGNISSPLCTLAIL